VGSLRFSRRSAEALSAFGVCPQCGAGNRSEEGVVMMAEPWGVFLQGSARVAATASTGAVVTLVVIIVTAGLFTYGVWLAAHEKFTAHGRVQTIAFVLNTALVLAWMVRSFVRFILPDIPANLGQRSYAVTTVHAFVGLIGMLLGLYVVLLGWGKLPASLKAASFRPYMRTSYVIYMLATVGGVVVYVLLYGPGSA
jgi:uncharacterized membrane protein YozB (DUF420 family)